MLILAGQSPAAHVSGGDDTFTREEGAGKIVLPTNGYGCFSKASIASTGAEVEVEIPVETGRVARLEAALWWPETPLSEYSVAPTTNTHNDIDLELVDPDRNVVASSRVRDGVFERCTATPSGTDTYLTGGTWKIRIIGNDVQSGPQTVYWITGARY